MNEIADKDSLTCPAIGILSGTRRAIGAVKVINKLMKQNKDVTKQLNILNIFKHSLSEVKNGRF
jgi:hypothetical protein